MITECSPTNSLDIMCYTLIVKKQIDTYLLLLYFYVSRGVTDNSVIHEKSNIEYIG